METKLSAAFSLGAHIALQVHGIERKQHAEKTEEVFARLQDVATGEVTILDSPKELLSAFPTPPADLLEKHPEYFRDLHAKYESAISANFGRAIALHRTVAAEILQEMKNAGIPLE